VKNIWPPLLCLWLLRYTALYQRAERFVCEVWPCRFRPNSAESFNKISCTILSTVYYQTSKARITVILWSGSISTVFLIHLKIGFGHPSALHSNTIESPSLTNTSDSSLVNFGETTSSSISGTTKKQISPRSTSYQNIITHCSSLLNRIGFAYLV
jgi:hypothetical protein